ncbi:hypothetical protein HELRODRAFT_173530 [Helobdella robusta]|uniref:Uncharacterized protein n=1 Tax=Helobdella robusta TaxID=6412 RepID=T1F6Y2_HELRO|nr:hypothetical protein HELRODRAFT_173530 [Helobdella robusta]ESO03828.1 hypothetical protein HELRODRAFT_173530 [Helobdella robusta]
MIADSSLNLPPRTIRKHHHQSHGYPLTSSSSHVSRRVHLESDELPIITSYSRGYSQPPSSYSEVLLADGMPVGRSNQAYGDAKRASMAADTAVRQAQREVNRVEQELGLSHYDEPSSFARKHRSYSYSGPRDFAFVGPKPIVHQHHTPATYHYHHRAYQSPSYYEVLESAPAHRPLYPPEKLVRCLTETPVTKLSGRHVEDVVLGSSLSGLGSALRSRSHTPQLHIAPLPPAPVVSRRSHVVHRHVPRYSSLLTSSSALNRLPDSVGHWYHHKPASTHFYGSSYDLSSPIVASYHQPIRNQVVMTSSSAGAAPVSATLGPSPPYHTRVINDGSSFEYSSSNHTDYPILADYSPWIAPQPVAAAPIHHQHYQHTVRRVQSLAPSSIHISKASSLSPSLDKPLESHIEVSEARKKVREVLCKVKRDATYFD